jgi:cytochrome c
MFTLENIMLKKTLIGLSLTASMFVFSGCVLENSNASKTAVDGGMKYETKDGKYTAYHLNTQEVKNYDKGRLATNIEIAAWDRDTRPDGTGLPMYDMKHGKPVTDENGDKIIAEGTVGLGNELYDAQCVMCHGDFGAGGVGGYPALSGGNINSLTNQLQNPADEVPNQVPPSKRIGSYWPYASTLFWYIQDSMPFPHPKSLTNSETYAISAYLLMENGIKIEGEEMDEDFVMNKEEFLKIKMPNVNGFYPNVDTPENPRKGVQNITDFLGDPKNYGTGTRCMSDCIKGEVPLLRIKNELNNFNPPVSTKRDLPDAKTVETVKPGQQAYENSCSACHGNAAIGAPVVGDKSAWKEVMNKGLDKVYHNGINGINSMPPKGGNMDLSDEEMKTIINYMINSSK